MNIILSCEMFSPVRIYETGVPIETGEKLITEETWKKINKWQLSYVHLSSLTKDELVGKEVEIELADEEGGKLIVEMSKSIFETTSNIDKVMYFSLIKDRVLRTVYR